MGAAGFDYDPATEKVRNLREHSRLLGKRARQVETNIAKLQAEWAAQNPGRTPDKALRRMWDQQAWAMDRPRKANANLGSEERWVAELRAAGLQVDGFAQQTAPALDQVRYRPRQSSSGFRIGSANTTMQLYERC